MYKRQAQAGRADDPRTAAALAFALKLVRDRGQVGDADVAALRQAGFDDGQIVELLAHVALNLFTNYVNVAFDVPVDFPRVASVSYTHLDVYKRQEQGGQRRPALGVQLVEDPGPVVAVQRMAGGVHGVAVGAAGMRHRYHAAIVRYGLKASPMARIWAGDGALSRRFRRR